MSDQPTSAPIERPPGEYAIVERWLPIPSYEGIYEVSDQGRVRRIGGAQISGKGRGSGARLGRVLALCKITGGYYSVNLWKRGKIKRRLIHILVMEAFVGPAPDGHEVNHKDANKADNTVNNLEYMTRSENMLHAYRHGLYVSGKQHRFAKQRGEGHPLSKLTTEQVASIRRRYVPRVVTFQALADEFGVNNSTIQNIVKERTWL